MQYFIQHIFLNVSHSLHFKIELIIKTKGTNLQVRTNSGFHVVAHRKAKIKYGIMLITNTPNSVMSLLASASFKILDRPNQMWLVGKKKTRGTHEQNGFEKNTVLPSMPVVVCIC